MVACSPVQGVRMGIKPSRRNMLKTAGLAALAVPVTRVSRLEASHQSPEPHGDLPKICLDAGTGGPLLGASADAAAAAARRILQLGVEHVISSGGPIPWEEARLQGMMGTLKANGLTLANLMIVGFPNAIYNRPGKDQDIERVIQSIKSA